MHIEEQKVSMRYTKKITEIIKNIEECARNCYQSQKSETIEDAIKFIRKLVGAGHLGVLEHEYVTMRIVTNRAIANQIVRHRLFSFCQESTRYCNYDDLGIILPDGIDSENERRLIDHVQATETFYKNFNQKNDIRRDILPLCKSTVIYMTGNLRSWKHFIETRTTPGCHNQIKTIALMAKEELETFGLGFIFENRKKRKVDA